MEQKTRGNTSEIRLYTGNGFEDFLVGETVKGNHIFSEASTKILNSIKGHHIRKVIAIEIFPDVVCIDFDSGESFEYYGLSYRHSGLHNQIDL